MSSSLLSTPSLTDKADENEEKITEFEDWYAKMGHDYKNYFEAVISDKRFPELRTRIDKRLSNIKKDKF